jgi:hypothetical protein
MTLRYDIALFDQFRALAVTDPDEIQVGATYWSNTYPECFQVVRVMTDRDFKITRNREDIDRADDHQIRWVQAIYFTNALGSEDEKLCSDYDSLWDRNCGRSYNPWLIFRDPETAERCRSELKIEYETDEWDRIENTYIFDI